MKIGILSDTHNHSSNTQTALEALRERGATKLIHCGDINTPDIIYLFMGWDVTFVLGNTDQNRYDLARAAQEIGAPVPQPVLEVDAGGKWIGVTHGNDYNALFRLMICCKYTYICHGHTHERRDEYRSAYAVRVINPGALGGSQRQVRSVCLLDTDADTVEFIQFPELV